MTFQIAMLGLILCLPVQLAGKPVQDSPTPSKSAPKAQRSLTGCIDQQDGQYVLLDDQMLKIANLQSAGSEKEVFAKYVGIKVQVRGATSSGANGTFKVTSIAHVAGDCGKAK
jgi:hypothetical protein